MLKPAVQEITEYITKDSDGVVNTGIFEILNKYPCICLTDCEARVKFINDNFERQTGYSLDEIKDRKIGAILQRDDMADTEKDRMRTLMDRGEPFYNELSPNYTRSGKKVKCKIHVIPLLRSGRIHSFLSFANFVPFAE